MIRKAVLPVAGFGTRMLPVTKVIPKELLPLLNRPVIEYVVDEVIASGLDSLIFVISYGKEAILDYFDIDLGLKKFLKDRNKEALLKLVEEVEEKIKYLSSIRQKIPQGLGHAVLMSERLVGDEPFAVILGDDLVDSDIPCLRQMNERYLELSSKTREHSIIALEEVPLEDVSKYGIIDGERLSDDLILIKKVVEKPSIEEAPSNLSIIGRYIFDPIIFKYLKEIPKISGEYQLTDAIQKMIEDGYPVYGYLFQGKRLDTGNPKGFFEATLHYALKDPALREVLRSFCANL
ncbi:UTP--glucose-1-phosphate uridylyltransferase [Caldimicrobium thiodismutans]|uniref:UTP--glucose-1-phosphate uridylyltransferase n=1 Tax=Caldimicrobium thiodismutans TaxID=1653476 RepID=A0A0U5B587_9BACT|nr:UTP--glucose-1-phosphate uridylyltransferase [Caldimicrobium thiodismutans]BAU23232.1 UTP--glucose-1-phosphate uridylyltransferase [Caldimicrobium thiodismutans]